MVYVPSTKKVRKQGGTTLSGLSAAAPEVQPDVESGSADRGVPGGSKGELAKRNKGEEAGRGGGGEEEDEAEDEEEDEAEDDEDRYVAPHGPRCNGPDVPDDPKLFFDVGKSFPPTQLGENGSR
jgi:hypothetical protein